MHHGGPRALISIKIFRHAVPSDASTPDGSVWTAGLLPATAASIPG
jgi:hypothetical protein